MASITAVSIVDIIADMVRVTVKITHHLHNVHTATSEAIETDRCLMIELPLLIKAVDSVKPMLEDDRPASQDIIRHLLPIFVACGTDVKRLYDIISRTSSNPDSVSAERPEGTAENLDDHTSTQELVHSFQGYTKFFSFYSAVYCTSLNASEDPEVEELRTWLSPSDLPEGYLQTLTRRQLGTGEWLLKDARYVEWRKNPGLIWLCGAPGSGKTTLSSIVLEDIESYIDRDPGRAVLYFFFDFKDPRKQDAKFMVSSLITQLFRRAAYVPKSLRELYETCRLATRHPSLDELLVVLKDMIRYFPEMFLVVDALDESVDQLEMTRIITTISCWTHLKLHTLLTSRKQYDISGVSEGLLPESNRITLRPREICADIRQFVRERLKNDAGDTKWNNNDDIRETIETIISENANGIFRWAFCQLDVLGKCTKEEDMVRSLESLPSTLEETYDQILCSIPPEEIVYTQCILRWIAFAGRPLYIEEIAEIIAIDSGHETNYELMPTLADPLELSVICSALVEVRPERESSGQEARLVVTLGHHSVKEYLLSRQISEGPASSYGLDEQVCHTLITNTCIGLLVRKSSPAMGGQNVPRFDSLTEYAEAHWLDHVRAATEYTEATDELLFDMLAQRDWYNTWQRSFDMEAKLRRKYFEPFLEDVISPIHFVSYFGLSTTLERLVREGNTHVYDVCMRTHSPLALAASQGHTETMRMLIRYGAPASEGHGYLHREPLVVAIRAAQVKAVEMLMREGAYANIQYLNSVPLQEAIDTGSARLVSLLIEHGADISNLGLGTPLHRASERGHKHIVELLLENDAEINVEVVTHKTHYHGTALYAAATQNHLEVAKLLLDWGADVNSGPKLRPLVEAATCGSRDMVETLLRRGANPNLTGAAGATALRLALQHGHAEIAWLLISYGADLGPTDERLSILHYVLETGHDALAVALMQRRYVAVPRGRVCPALPVACAHGCSEAAGVMLVQPGGDVDRVHARYGTALQAAAGAGRWELVRVLLANGADPNRGSRTLSGPLQTACAKGQQEVVALLLQHGADENGKGFPGKGPLQIAYCHGYDGIVWLLLENGANRFT